MERIFSYFQSHLPELYRALIILVLTILAARLAKFSIERYIKSAARRLHREIRPEDLTRIKVLIRFLVILIYFFGILASLYQFEAISKLAATLFASVGIIGVILGIAAQSTFGSIFSSFIVSTSQPFKLGDEIEVEGKAGKVKEITLFYTRVELADGSILVIPNKKLTEISIVNHTRDK